MFLSQNELEKVVKQIGRNGMGVQSDVSNLADLDRLYEMVKQQKGRIDVLFANAGLWELTPLEAITQEHFYKIFIINVKWLLFTVQKALPLFQDGGSIILTGAGSASKGFAGFSVYSASKAAIRSFARSWTVDLKNRKIRVNTISPGPIDTLAVRLSISEQLKKNILSTVPKEGWATQKKSQKPSPSLHQMTAVISQVLNCSSTVV
jgi:NAD(P)-dependent dehydrogenase (short-subunit alcohol dehydrogenase family)